MRVCKIWDSEYPWDVRVAKVTRALTAASHTVHLVARNRARRPVRERLDDIEIHRLAPWPWLGRRLDGAAMFPAFFNPRWRSAILTTARESHADLLMVRDLPLAPTAVWAARRLGIPVVLDMAENYPAMMRGLAHARVQRRTDVLVRNPRMVEAVERWVLARVDHVLVVVEESRDRLLALGVDPSRVTVVSNTPWASRLLQPAKQHRVGRPLELVYLGLLEAPRGVEVVIDAIARLRRAGVAARLTLIGDGRERARFEARARALGLGDDGVRFLGRLPYDDALRIVREADVGVIPHVANESWNTTIPNKLFDYMAAGLAVLASNARPVARVVEETGAGLVYQHDDPGACAAAIAALTCAETRARCGADGRAAVADRYHWERDARAMLAALESVLPRRGRVPAPMRVARTVSPHAAPRAMTNARRAP